MTWKLIISSPNFNSAARLYVKRGAKWQELTPQQLRKHLELGEVWGLKQGNSCQSIAIQSHLEGYNKILWVGYAIGSTESLPTLLYELRQLGHTMGYPAVGGFFPQSTLVLESLDKTGYRKDDEEQLWVYEWHNISDEIIHT